MIRCIVDGSGNGGLRDNHPRRIEVTVLGRERGGLHAPHVPAGSGLADHDLTDLHDRLQVGVVGDVAHDALGVGREGALKVIHRLEQEVCHGDECGLRSGLRTAQALAIGLSPPAGPNPARGCLIIFETLAGRT